MKKLIVRNTSIDIDKIRHFKKIVTSFYKKHKRSFPWRETRDPYAILISEVMLQQTQTSRVVDFYHRFLEVFPNFERLAAASTEDLLRLWKGLGYNRRALALRAAAQEVMKSHDGLLPREINTLMTLPGIGPYTAQAVCAFAHNDKGLLIETNIRTVLIHHFFSSRQRVDDRTLADVLAKLLPRRNVRDWYYALMDYGVYLKAQGVKTHRQSKHYKKQARFEGSIRQLRGKVLEVLLKRRSTSAAQIAQLSNRSVADTQKALTALVREGVLICAGERYRLST